MRSLLWLRLIGVVVFLCLFGLLTASCTGPPGPAGAPGPAGPAGAPGSAGAPAVAPEVTIVVVPVTIDLATAEIAVYGSGFTPNESVSLRLVGTFKLGKEEIINPSVWTGPANESGAFEASVTRLNRIFGLFGVEPGVYGILASQERVKAIAPLEIKES